MSVASAGTTSSEADSAAAGADTREALAVDAAAEADEAGTMKPQRGLANCAWTPSITALKTSWLACAASAGVRISTELIGVGVAALATLPAAAYAPNVRS